MTDARYKELESNIELRLTEEEMAEGWHFCMEFDGLLLQGDPDQLICGPSCWKIEDVIAETRPVS